MGTESVELLAAAVVGLALLWLVLQPIVVPAKETIEVYEPPEPEETPRGQALLALKEIEFDKATGKLSDVDFATLHARYSARALAVLGDVAEPAGGATAPGASGDNCPACHRATVVGAWFCGACGTTLRAAVGS